MEKKLLFIVNPRAGRTKSRAPLYEALLVYAEAGYLISIAQTAAPGDATRIAQERSADFDLVVCHGGDGTLNETLNGLMRLPAAHRPPLGYLPGGSTNDFAASLGIPLSPPAAARSSMRRQPRVLDVGRFNDRFFAYVASFGAFTRTAYTVPQDVKNAFGHAAYFLAGVKDLETLRPYPMKLKADGERLDGEYLFGAVSNSTSIAGMMKLPERDVSLNDGRFELLLVPVPRTAAALQATIYALLAQDYENSDGLIFRHVENVVAESAENIPWTLDGEYAPGAPRFEIGIENGGVTLLL